MSKQWGFRGICAFMALMLVLSDPCLLAWAQVQYVPAGAVAVLENTMDTKWTPRDKNEHMDMTEMSVSL